MSHFTHLFNLQSAKNHKLDIGAATVLLVVLLAIAFVDLVAFFVCLGVLTVLPWVSRIFGDQDQ